MKKKCYVARWSAEGRRRKKTFVAKMQYIVDVLLILVIEQLSDRPTNGAMAVVLVGGRLEEAAHPSNAHHASWPNHRKLKDVPSCRKGWEAETGRWRLEEEAS
jgi:hypothetical protein